MQLSDVPASSRVDISSTVFSIARALWTVLGKDERPRTFHYEPVQGTSRSERLISLKPLEKSVPMGDEVRSTEDLAQQLLILAQTGEARYPPAIPSLPTRAHGWEVRRTYIKNQPVAYVCAAWV